MAKTDRSEEQLSNDGAASIAAPFSVSLTIDGTADLLFHRWSNESVAEKSAAAKGSKAKKSDDVESYVYRDAEGRICIPGRYVVRSVVEAGRFYQDPRSSRKMAKELVQAGVICEDVMSPVLVNGEPAVDWDYLDRQRVTIMRSAITRTRPAFTKGWQCRFTLTSILPEYISPAFLRTLVDGAGKFIGLADFRPTYGRFVVSRWEHAEPAA
ncbi:MAG: hypothetical protein LBL73_08865 [Synergistaceae bacterium]|jgi:hypothetical protein|nr:hypothetical protein [Synergistaceae bacterium]